MFPTCVGMNRSLFAFFAASSSVPHMRGDEPEYRFTDVPGN